MRLFAYLAAFSGRPLEKSRSAAKAISLAAVPAAPDLLSTSMYALPSKVCRTWVRRTPRLASCRTRSRQPVWSLILVVTVKYVMIIMRADNKGEGGILAMMALVQRSLPIASPVAYGLGILGIFGTALFFGDRVITPAISVLGAVEGLEIAAPGMTRFVVQVTLVILVLLFSLQRPGTDKVGKVFGPITIAWFFAIAVEAPLVRVGLD